MNVLKLFEESFIPSGQVFDSIAEGVCIAGANFEFLYWNQSAREILFDEPDNCPPSQWAARYGLYDISGENHLKYEDLPMVKALNGETFTDYRIISKSPLNPEGYILSVNGRPIRNGVATVAGITTFRDITSTMKLEREIIKERAFYKNILDLMPGIVFIKDLEGKFVYGNKSFHELLKTGSIQGRTTEDYLVQDEAKTIRENDKLVLQTAEPHIFEEIIHWKNGTRSIFHTMRFPYYNAENKVSGVCAVARDITREVDDRIQLENERIKSAHVSKLASLGTLAAEITHELRNPLTILSTSAKVIQVMMSSTPAETESIKKQLNLIDQTVFRMNDIIKSLTSLSRDSSKEPSTKFKAAEMLHDIETICKYRTSKAKIEFEIQFPKGDPGYIKAHQVQLSEVILNILMNAFDAVEFRKSPRVWLKVWRDSHDMIFEIYDSGMGVSSIHRDKIFEPYFTTKEMTKGTGLGLSIATKIIKQHHGKLEYIHTEKDHFFRITVPIGN